MGAFISILFLFFLVFVFSALVGAVMFCIDIWKWSKRPEVFVPIEKDLEKDLKEDLEKDSSDEPVEKKGSIWNE